MERGIFAGSNRILDVVDRHDWKLYDITNYGSAAEQFVWDVLEREKPAQFLELGGNYLLIPKPKKGQTLERAYAQTQGIGPSLWVPDFFEMKDIERQGSLIIDDHYVCLFNQLLMAQDGLYASLPIVLSSRPPIMKIPYTIAADKFAKYFRITTRERLESLEGELEISLPSIKEFNNMMHNEN